MLKYLALIHTASGFVKHTVDIRNNSVFWNQYFVSLHGFQ